MKLTEQQAVLTSQQSQVIVAKQVVELDGFNTAIFNTLEFDIQRIFLAPRLGQTQYLSIALNMDGTFGGGPYTLTGTLEIALHDKMFEEFDEFGQRKTSSDKAKDKRAAQGEF